MEKESQASNTDIITDSTFFIYQDSKECRKFCMTSMGKVKLLKKDIDLRKFKNFKLNSFWEHDTNNDTYNEITSSVFFKENLIDNEVFDYSNEKIISANNKEIFTTSADEQRNRAEIALNLKESGVKGQEMIDKIVEGNSSLIKRTLLSQEKILKKYEQRHTHQIYLTKPTLFNITETMFLDRIQSKIILHMRFDTVCTILQSIKFLNRAKTCIYDQTNGFLTAAIAARTSNTVVSLFDLKPNQRSIAYFNYKKEIKEKITYFSYDYFTNELQSNSKFGLHKSFSNLVICNKEENKLFEIVMSLIESLKPSGILIVYARDKEYLILIEKILLEKKIFLGLSINETYMREYQILPLRTHPNMNNKGFSNYVLIGTKTAD